MTSKVDTIVTALTATVAMYAIVLMTASAQQMPQTTKESLKGRPSFTTQHLQGTVVYVESNDLVVRTTDGDYRDFRVPESRSFIIIDGREVTVHDLRPGTTLSATVTTATTPVIERTTTIGSGKVWWVAGNTLIVTLPNGENRTYMVNDDYRFSIDGNGNATVFNLRKGMTVSAKRIVEQPRTEIVSVGSSRVDLQACKLEYSIVSPK